VRRRSDCSRLVAAAPGGEELDHPVVADGDDKDVIRRPRKARLFSIIVIVVEADPGAAGLSGLALDRQMRPQLDFHGNLAGRRREPLTDADGYPRSDVFPGAQSRAARCAAGRSPRVQGAARRSGRAGAEFEPIEVEAAAQPIEHAWTAAREGAGRCRQLQPFPGTELTDTPVEQHAREDLILRRYEG
jgi:hypothetical protein